MKTENSFLIVFKKTSRTKQSFNIKIHNNSRERKETNAESTNLAINKKKFGLHVRGNTNCSS